MYARILAALMLIPFGLATLMRGSDGMNRGDFGAGEGGVLAMAGAAMIFAGLGLLMGALAAGVLGLIGLIVSTVVWWRQRRRSLGRRLRPGDASGRAAFAALITLFIILGWQ